MLSLPPMGDPHAALVTQSAGDRLSVTTTNAPDQPRLLVSPTTAPSAPDSDVSVLGVVELPLVEGTGGAELDDGVRSLGNVTDPAREDEDSSATSTEAPTSTSTSTSTTTTVAPTTTEAPTTTQAPATTAAPVDGDGGVLISPNGVVLPVIGPGANGGWRALTPCGNEVTTDQGERVLSVDFVLDPGHGGSETGAVGPNGSTEKALNQRIAEITEWYLEEAGYSVLLTRRTDIRIPLRSRAEIANALQPLAFISIHHNGGAIRPQSTPGTEMFVDAGNPESRRLGGLLFEELHGRLSNYDADWVGTWRNGVSARLNSDGEDLYGIHRYTPGVVSVITEAGYLSNPSEAALYTDNDVQWAHGRAIAEGLMRWDRSSDGGTGFLDDFVDDSSSGTGGFDGCTDPQL